MACGKPVLALDAGGTREIIEDNETGFLITDHNRSKAEEIISRLLESDVLRHEVGRKARALIESRFALDGMGRNFEGLYQTLQIRSGKKIL
jgi:glycosyltransferase involved in cell wall biosynthesis